MTSGSIQILERRDLSPLPERTEDLLRQLGRPTLIRVPGRDRARVRALTTLLHGDEPSGTRAVHAWLRSGVEPATSVLIYIGTVDAALGDGGRPRRMLPGRRDGNRCFAPPFDGQDGTRARALLELLAAARPEALVDLHNNSGRSPAYAVGTTLAPAALALTSLFADCYVHTDLRLGTLIEATSAFTTSIVVECGRASDPVADAVALAGVERYLSIDALPSAPPPDSAPGLTVLHRPVRVKVRDDVRLAFAPEPLPGIDLTIRSDIDRHNLAPLAAGTVFGWLGDCPVWPFDARGANGVEVSAELFSCANGVLRTRRPFIPVMMTSSAEAARNDCLFYAMERR